MYTYDADGNIISPATFIERFGIEVDITFVPALVRAGFDVWSYGYGQMDNDDPGTFTVITEDDLDAWDDADDLPADWGPFAAGDRRVRRSTSVGSYFCEACGWSRVILWGEDAEDARIAHEGEVHA
jgi:hypothetical protein